MEHYNLNLGSFIPPLQTAHVFKYASISPKLDKLCVLSQDDAAAIYLCSSSISSNPIWTGNAKFTSLHFSSDGDELLGTTEKGTIYVFRCQGRHIIEIAEKNISQLVSATVTGNIDSSKLDLNPIVFTKKLFVLLCKNEFLVGVEWNEGELWRRLYVTKTDPPVGIAVKDEFIYLLCKDGELLTYCSSTGHQVGQINIRNAICQGNASIGSCEYTLLAMSATHVAVSDVNDQIYLFTLEDLESQKSEVFKAAKDLGVVRRLSSSADQFPMSSSNVHVFRGSESYPKKDMLQHRKNFPDMLSKSSSIEEASEPTLDYALITSLEGFTIQAMSFIESGLSVWYSQGEGCGVYRVYNAQTGICMLEESLAVGTTAILAGYLGSVDAFISPEKLHIHLCGVSKEQLAMEVLRRVGVSGISQVLQGTGWQDIDVALPVLSEGISVRQLDIINLAIKLYVEGFRHSINESPHSKSIDIIVKNMKKIYSILFSGIEDNLHTLHLAENLVTISLNLCYDLLSILYQKLEIHQHEDWFEITEQEIMKAVVSLRAYLYHPPQTQQQETCSNVPTELEGLSPQVREMWELWHNLPQEEIIFQAVEHGFLPMAQTFFVTVTHKSQEEVSHKIRSTIDEFILKYLKECQVSQCQKILQNMGYEPMEKLKDIYLSTFDHQLQNFLFGFLSNHDVLSQEEISAGLFLRHLKQSLEKKLSHWHGAKLLEDQLPMNVGFVKMQPTNWRDQIWAELALNSMDPDLHCTLVPNATWSYLLIANRIDLLQMWADQQFSNQNSTVSSSIQNEEEIAFIEKLKILFSSWEITTDMVDAIFSADCLKTTKEFALDHLSRFGIFSTSEKSSLSMILMRFVRTNNLSNIECVLNHPASVITYQDFSKLLLKFCLQHRIGNVLFSCLKNISDISEILSDIEASESSTLWLQSWLDLVKLADQPENNMLKAMESSLQYLAEGDVLNYLEKRPYLILAYILLSKHSTCELLSETPPQIEEPLTVELLEVAKKSIPVLNQVISSQAWDMRQLPDITLYELLEKSTLFDISKLFGWQEDHRKKSDDAVSHLPHFSSGSVFENYAHQETLNYEFYLKQGRPSYAYYVFILEQFKYHRKISKKRKKQVCNIAHGLALRYFYETHIVAACISFIGMIGLSSEKARLHVTVGNCILQGVQCTLDKPEVYNLLQLLLYRQESAAVYLLSVLETALVPSDVTNLEVQPLQSWAIAVKFARVHNLPLPESLPILYAKSDMWLPFVICLELYQYPIEQALRLTEKCSNKKIREHLLHAFNKTADKTATVIANKTDTQLKLRDARKFLYSKIGLTAEERGDTSSDTSSSITESGAATAKSWGSDTPSLPGLTSSCVLRQVDEGELFSTLLACHASLDPPHALLNASLNHSSPLLAVLASCYESCSIVACMGTWLVASMSGSARTEAVTETNVSLQNHAWNSADIKTLWILAVGAGYVSTLNTALKIFLPENPMFALTEFIKLCVIDKSFDESVGNIQLFKAKCQNLPVAVNASETGSFLNDRHWIYSVAVQVVCTTLAKCFSSSFHQYRFLQVLCQSAFSEYISVEAPDFMHLQQLQECLLETGVQLDYSALCVERKGSERELQTCLDRLVVGGHFLQALKLARTAGLPRDAVVIAQWNHEIEGLQDSDEGNVKFWNKCQAAFEDANIQATVAAEFFQHHAGTRTFIKEKFLVLCLSHNWYSMAKQQSARKRPDCYLTKPVEVELDMWRTRLKLKTTNIDVQAKLDMPPKLFALTRKDVMLDAGVGFLDMETQLEDVEQIQALDAVIGELLDQGKVASAVRLEALFCHKNKDIQIILTCLSLAEGEILPYQLSSEQRTMIEQTLAPSGSFRRRPLHSLRLSSNSYSKLEMSLSPNNLSLTSEYVEVPPREQQDTLAAVEKLAERLHHGRSIGARIAACYRVSMNIDKSFVDIITMEDTLGLLKTAITKDCLNKFAVAGDLSISDQISKEDMAQYLCEEIMTAVSKGHMQGNSETACITAGGCMWGCELDTSFHLVLELCPDPTLLAKNLLNVAAHLNSSQPDAMKKVHVVVVELLIRAHDCFTAACDMEGIAQVLQKARSLTSNLLQPKEWQLMVRLVTGIGRYTEMGYIFQILKDHEQFEFLLGKGMDKVPGLKLALLEFVRSHCAQDRELLRLVALHFRLYSEVAELWDNEACATIHSLLNVTRLELSSNKTSTRIAYGTPTPKLLKASSDTAHLLKLAMQNFSHAAEYYLQANKLTKAMQSAHKAELVALQISLTQGVSANQTVDCLLDQEMTQVTHLITHNLSFPQASIVAKAYSHPVDWGAALYQHCVVLKEQKYLTDFMQAMTLTPALVEDVARRFERESAINKDMAQMMKQLVGAVQCVEVKYRVASQLGFKDILETMLAGPDLAYLKDTVWRRGLQKHHF